MSAYRLVLNGSTAFGYILDHPDFDFGSGDFTMTWWLYKHAWADGSVLFARDSSYVPGFLIGYDYSGESYIFMSSNGSSWDILHGLAAGVFLNAVADTKTHYIISRIGSDFVLYRNGSPYKTWSSSSALKSGAGSNIVVGISGYEFYNASGVEELCFYKGLGFNATQALADYNTTSGVYHTAGELNIVAGYHFDEGAGLLAADITGNHDMMLVNPGWITSDICIAPTPPASGANAIFFGTMI